jgi:RNA polymerase sigma factor (sigma-70 family)
LDETRYTKNDFHPSIYMKNMNTTLVTDAKLSQTRISEAYNSERPRFLSRLLGAGRTLEEAEDLIQDVYAEALEHLPLVSGISNLPAWINTLFTRRLIDAWRHARVQENAGETDVAEETLQEIIADIGLDPQDAYVRESLADALNDAMRALPEEQRQVVEAQVFGELTFREIAEMTGESIDTLTARKRYAIKNLSRTLRQWIED